MVEQALTAEKQCPFCAETIKAAAIRCRFCQSDLTDPAAPPSPEPPAEQAADEPTAPADRDDEESAPASTWTDGAASPKGSILASRRLTGILVALCLLLAGLAGYLWYDAENPEAGSAPDGVITSSGARDAGMQAASQLVQRALSFNWTTFDADVEAAGKVMTPDFRDEYSKTMGGLKSQTLKNQVKVSATVAASSILSASEKEVKALLFVTQSTTAKGTTNQQVNTSRVRATLTRADGEWRLHKLQPF